jgi:pyruvate dehydrogenase E1 component beta subunit
MFGGKAKVPMVIETLFGAGFRAAGQHSQCLYSVFTHMPGLKVVVPSTPHNAKGLMSGAIRDDDPVIYFVHKVLLDTSGPVPEDNYVIPLGQAELVREGNDATVVAIGRMRLFAEQVAAELAEEGIDVEIVDPQSLSPLDEDTILESVKKTHRLVVIDEDTPRCSIANDIVTLAVQQAFDYLDAPPKTVTAPHTPVPFSPALEDVYIPGPPQITDAIRAVMV